MGEAFRAMCRRVVPPGIRRARRVLARLPAVMARAAQRRRQRSLRLARGAPDTLLMHPCRAHVEEDYTVNLIACRLGLQLTSDPRARFSAALHWLDATRRPPNPLLEQLAASLPVINLRANDISKTRVDAVMQEVFGYGLAVDPCTMVGPLLEKSDLNALHDGRILAGPLPRRREGRVYQMLVRGRRDGDVIEELRVPVLGKRVPFVYLKYKRMRDPLALSTRGTITEPASVCAPSEIDALVAFARAMGIDFGEFDVIRHHVDGRLYVLDANTTPAVRFVGVSAADRRATIDRLAEAFDDVFLRPRST